MRRRRNEEWFRFKCDRCGGMAVISVDKEDGPPPVGDRICTTCIRNEERERRRARQLLEGKPKPKGNIDV